jgi:hypothetical protein
MAAVEEASQSIDEGVNEVGRTLRPRRAKSLPPSGRMFRSLSLLNSASKKKPHQAAQSPKKKLHSLHPNKSEKKKTKPSTYTRYQNLFPLAPQRQMPNRVCK